jgi:hypothetical protein
VLVKEAFVKITSYMSVALRSVSTAAVSDVKGPLWVGNSERGTITSGRLFQSSDTPTPVMAGSASIVL